MSRENELKHERPQLSFSIDTGSLEEDNQLLLELLNQLNLAKKNNIDFKIELKNGSWEGTIIFIVELFEIDSVTDVIGLISGSIGIWQFGKPVRIKLNRTLKKMRMNWLLRNHNSVRKKLHEKREELALALDVLTELNQDNGSRRGGTQVY